MRNAYNWYSQLKKPAWAPPSRLFGPVWTVLYILIAISFGKVFLMAAQGAVGRLAVWPLALNLIFNFAYTPLQFKLKNNFLAAIDVLLVLATLIWAMAAVWPHLRWPVYLLIPYLLWAAFAAILQLTITYLNK